LHYLPLRTRKFLGAIALVALLVTWALLAMMLAQAIDLRSNRILEFAFYVLAGIGWALPAMPLVRWMSRIPCR
jgi:hypothetical protein